jgi:uncharacterized protein YlxP (DUF503 family)
MNILVLSIDFRIPGVQSLKEKRHVLKSLKDRIRSGFNVSVAEVEFMDLWQRSKFGVAIVSGSKKHCDKIASAILKLIDFEPRVWIIDYYSEYFTV